MHQMGFSQSHASVQKQRVVHIAGRLRYGEGCGMGKLVVAADYEGVKRVFWIDIGLFIVNISGCRADSAVLWMLFPGSALFCRFLFCACILSPSYFLPLPFA